MSGPRQCIVISRDYKNSPNDCVQAIELLLKKSVRKKGGPETAPDDAMKGSKHDRASNNHNR